MATTGVDHAIPIITTMRFVRQIIIAHRIIIHIATVITTRMGITIHTMATMPIVVLEITDQTMVETITPQLVVQERVVTVSLEIMEILELLCKQTGFQMEKDV